MEREPISRLWLLSETKRELDWWTDMCRTGTDSAGPQRFARYLRWSGISGYLGRDILDDLRRLENAVRDTNGSRDDALNEIIKRLQRIEERACNTASTVRTVTST
jgi:hypothetical protein